MCSVRDLNKKSRELMVNGGLEVSDVVSHIYDFTSFVVHGSIEGMNKEELAKRIAGMQIVLLGICGKFEISDKEITDAACRIFDGEDQK